MKKVILLLITAGFCSSLKARQLQTPTATNTFKPDTGLVFKKFNNNIYKVPGLNRQSLAQLKPLTDGFKFYGNMPVATTFKDYDRMPIYIPGKPGEHYPMLIKRIDVINPDTVNKRNLIP